ncbi:MAG: copper amine oxidase N-terminal domain-containing protein, partial [Peptococcaceae bacterium]|nr:copper amine oxidase N-terminal domain-containing protein [Peptococcaceae bacterium]
MERVSLLFYRTGEEKLLRKTALILAFFLFLAMPAQVWAFDEIKVYIDGIRISFPDQAPYINGEGRAMVPVRFVSQDLGAEVDWDEREQTVRVRQEEKSISLRIGERKARVNASDVALDTAAALANNRTMV